MRPLPKADHRHEREIPGAKFWWPDRRKDYHEVGDLLLTPSPIWARFDGEDGAPDLHLLVEVINGVPRATEFHLERRPDGRAVQANDLRDATTFWENKILVAVIVASQRRHDDGTINHAVWETDTEGDGVGILEDHLLDAYAVRLSSRSANRNAPSEEHLRRVADVYNAHPRGGLKAVMTAFGNMPKATAARRIRAAREAGFIKEKNQ